MKLTCEFEEDQDGKVVSIACSASIDDLIEEMLEVLNKQPVMGEEA